MTDAKYECPKCHVVQNPDDPICVHLSGRRAGRASMAAKSPEQLAAFQRAAAHARWAKHYARKAADRP